MTEECGCRVSGPGTKPILNWPIEAKIIECPTHAAAFEMRRLLRDWAVWYSSPTKGRGCGTLSAESVALLARLKQEEAP